MLLASLALVALYAQTPLFARLQWWFDDAQQALSARQLPMEHVIVFDIDEESMQRLDGELGAWPYARNVYASVARFLAANGARAVAYDILFSEAREGDAEFAQALGGRSVLAAAALPYALRRPPAYHAQLAKLGWSAADAGTELRARAKPWTDLTLPLVRFTEGSGARAGVISGATDADGTLRRVHLVHEAYGQVLPSLPLGALVAAEASAGPRVEGGALRLGARAWPIAADGALALRFPSNARALPVVPFFQLATAARGAEGAAHIGDLVRGKLVFIGSSSAILGDFAYTPVGQMPGLHLVALVAEMLIEESVQRPSRASIDGLLVLLAFIPPLLAIGRARAARPRDFVLGLAAIVLVVAGGGAALHAAGQSSRWLFAAHAGLAAQAGALMLWLFFLSRERQRLYYEKLAAEKANQLKSAFLNRMTHELRTPLTAIMGFNKINQLTDDLGRAQRMRNTEIIGRNCDHLLSLVNENLDLARIEAGQLHAEPRPTDPTALFDDAIATMRMLAEQKGLRLALKVAQPLPPALSLDPLRLRQVLLNLLGNAVKFTDSGSVELAAGWDADSLRFSVRDTGPGIESEAMGRVFEPFARDAASGVEGAGLGLAVTRELVRLMQGTIGVESVPNQGTCFTVRLPATAAAMPAVGPLAAAAQAPLAALAGKVLIAEDNEDLQALLQFQLTELGLECVAVGDGFRAVEVAASGDFDLVMMDMEMPRMDGYEAVHVLRARGYQRPIIAFTAHESGADAERALAAGCDRVLGKPCTLERLRDALAPHVEAREAPRRAPSAAATAIRVDADPRLRDLVVLFLEHARRDAAHIGSSLDARDLEQVRRVGHTLKGSGSSFGFDALAQLGGMLEHAARNADVESARRIGARLQDYLSRVEPSYGAAQRR